MPAVVWSSGVFPLALWLASVCIFVASPMANAFLTAAPVSSRLARGAAAAVDTNRAKGVAFDGERSRQATVLSAIKKKVDYNKKESVSCRRKVQLVLLQNVLTATSCVRAPIQAIFPPVQAYFLVLF